MWRVVILLWVILAPTIAGLAVMVVLGTPALSGQAMKWIPIVAVLGAIVAIPVSAVVAKMITSRMA